MSPTPATDPPARDAHLVRLTTEGDLRAFEQLVERHRDVVVRVAAQLYLAAVVVRDILHPWRDPVRLTAAAAGERLDFDPMEPVTRR